MFRPTINSYTPINIQRFNFNSKIVAALSAEEKIGIILSEKGLKIIETKHPLGFIHKEESWNYTTCLGEKPVIHIIGAGHVGLALSKLMVFLGFRVKIYDDRTDLNTLEENTYAHEKRLLDYSKIGNLIAVSPQDYAVILTFGYRSDKLVFEELLNKECYYLGMMGSEAKLKALFEELEEEGIAPKRWEHVFTPIGINIQSKTPEEIALSIAAEVIREKNKNLSSGRRPS